ncbi:MAG TPA: hypothetical protein VG676_10810, partial [Chitinophagaceae bacterium]|nr:hypothetical protein [Chitinophagaceae bacterium]
TLGISRDSAYRRIRGETLLSLDEVKIIHQQFGVSVDTLLTTSPSEVSFRMHTLDSKNFSFDKYLNFLLENLEKISGYPEKEIIWYAKDLPIWHYFRFPALASFKFYFWDKTFVKGSKLRAEKYRQEVITKDLLALAGRVWSKYAAIPSTEILGNENLDSTLNQIAFAYECGVFNSKKDAMDLCDECCQLMEQIKSEAEEGLKKGIDMCDPGERFALYHNEVLIGDNSVLFKIADRRMAFITANQFSILTTTQESFCRLTEDYINNMINKSTLISTTAEKERTKFFNAMLDKIALTRLKIR